VQTSRPLCWTVSFTRDPLLRKLNWGQCRIPAGSGVAEFPPPGLLSLPFARSALQLYCCPSLWACLYSRPSPLPPPLSPKIIFAARRFGLCVYWCSGTRKLFKCSARAMLFQGMQPQVLFSLSACVLYSTQYMRASDDASLLQTRERERERRVRMYV